jgi:2-(1,2-epoxy-1,2-dihydrophenyl)acetyl-CoA isomerase
MKEAKGFAARIAKGPSVAVELNKRAVYKGLENDLATQLAYETWAQNICQQTEDAQEGRRSFIEKREPVFKGR